MIAVTRADGRLTRGGAARSLVAGAVVRRGFGRVASIDRAD